MNNKACKIQPWLRTDLKSSPPTSVIPKLFQFSERAAHRAKSSFQATLRRKRIESPQLLHLHKATASTTHTSSCSFIGRQLCCVWESNVKKKNAFTILKTNNTGYTFDSKHHNRHTYFCSSKGKRSCRSGSGDTSSRLNWRLVYNFGS